MSVLPNFINGQFVPSSGTDTVPVINPATGQEISRVPCSTAADVDNAVQIGKEVFKTWSKDITIKQRTAIMMRFHALLVKHSDELAQMIVDENGKNFAEALADVAKGNETVEWACSLPQLAPGRHLEVSRGISCAEYRDPIGVVGCIVPFNFPVMVPLWTVPIALVMGNCVVCKPSEKVPAGVQRMAELFKEAGLPDGVFQVVHGTAEAVTSICKHPDIAAVSFVGSSKVGQIVTDLCNESNKRILALGGAKNHLIAVPDCDVGMAARDIVASFAGCCGQRCMAASVLVLVDNNEEGGNPVLNELLDAVVKLSAALKPGQKAGEVGPVIDAGANRRIRQYIDEAESRDGAEVLLDGRDWTGPPGCEGGNWIGPTILLHKSSKDPAMQDEIFGPVLSVLRVNSWQEAITVENANPYGNAACIYTERGAVAEWFTSRFRAGMLGVNIGIPVPREPFSFGGMYGTRSKFGTSDITGDGAMEFFSNRRKVTSKWFASYGTSSTNQSISEAKSSEPATKRMKVADTANFDGKM
jgi:methylmalonic acid semialdehyde dehydrogenase